MRAFLDVALVAYVEAPHWVGVIEDEPSLDLELAAASALVVEDPEWTLFTYFLASSASSLTS
jgi:hypothetical protein